MQTDKPVLLSIAVPTFNRCNKLAVTLNSILDQVRLVNSPIEIIVSDNASSDGTEQWVRSWIERHPNALIRYFRNDNNVGVDANTDAAVRRATGIFVWLFADDDFLERGAIPRVYSLLEDNKDVVFAFVNYSVIVEGFRERSSCSPTNTARVRGLELIAKTQFAFSFVSSCIFRREHWLSLNASQYIGSNWIVIFMARDILLLGDALLIAEELIRMNGLDLRVSRKEKRSEGCALDWYVIAHLNFLNFASSLKDARYPDQVVREAIRVAWRHNLRQILYFKATADRYRLAEITYVVRKMAEHFGSRLSFWMVDVPVLFLPNSVVAALFWNARPLYKKVKRRIRAYARAG